MTQGNRWQLVMAAMLAVAAGLLACARAAPLPGSAVGAGSALAQPVRPGGRIEGIVRDAEGRAVSDALVAVIPASARSEAKLVKSDRDGRFGIQGLTAGRYALTATAPGRVGAYHEPVQLAEDALQRVELLMTGEALTLRGSIKDRSGRPVGNATIRAFRSSMLLADIFIGKSDESGAFAITVPKGRYTVTLEAGDLGAAPRIVEGSGEVAIHFDPLRLFAADQPAPREVVEWLRANAIPLATPEAGHGFDDLQALKQVVGNARIVALGEATHGTREFFQLKHRMLEFLAIEMGFTVFGIEASYPEALAVNDYVLHGRGDPADALAGMRFWTWDTEEVLEQIRWMRRYNEDPSHKLKLKFHGFDMQSPSGAVQRALEYLQKVDRAFARQVARKVAPLDNDFDVQDYALLPKARIAMATQGLASILKRLDEAKSRYVRRSSAAEWSATRMNAQVAIQGEQQARKRSSAFRDRSMAENIKALLDHEPPGARMVLWAHNGHVSKGDASGGAMGVHLAKMFDEDLVVFGFAFNEGSFQAMQMPFGKGGVISFTVAPAPPGSLDASLSTAGKLFAIDLRRAPREGMVAEWLNSPLRHRDIGAGFSYETAEWFLTDEVPRRNYDAMLFIDKTSSARPNPSGKRSGPPLARQILPKMPSPVNLDFEETEADGKPTGWIAFTGGEKGSYAVTTSDAKPFQGHRCASIIRDRAPWPWGFGALLQNFDATAYRGKRIRFRAAARAEISGVGNKSELFVRVLPVNPHPPGKALSFVSTLDQPMTSDWKFYDVEVSVPTGADSVNVGLILAGNGRVWFDDASIEIVGEATSAR